jgi:hypothetical protein
VGTPKGEPAPAATAPAKPERPEVVTPARVTREVEAGGTELFRGFPTPAHAAAARRGELRSGEGDYGTGIYTTTDARHGAASYAAGPTGASAGGVVRMALRRRTRRR